MQTQDTSQATSFEQIEQYLKSSKGYLPEIRYWDGTDYFSDSSGNYKSSTLAGSIALFLKDANRN